MSLASVSAYLSPTILRNFSISSGESGGADDFAMFIFLALCPSVPPDGGAAQAIVDRLAQPLVRDRHDRDRARVPRIESTKIAEKIARGFSEIAARGQIHHGDGVVQARKIRGAEGEQRFAGLYPACVEADLCARRVMRGQHARRQRLRRVAGRVL